MYQGLPRWLSSKESACNAGDAGSTPGSGRSPGEGSGNHFQYACLAHSHGQRSLAGYTVHGIARVRHDLATNPPAPQIPKWPTDTKQAETMKSRTLSHAHPFLIKFTSCP